MIRLCLSVTLAHLALFVAAGVRVASADDESPPESLTVFPDRIALSTARDRQGIVVLANFRDGSTRDVAGKASVKIAGPSIAQWTGATLVPVADGSAQLEVEFAGLRSTIPVEVRGATEVQPLRFRNDVLPVLTRAGCNTGKCHGAASGKDGFRLSLFGYDPNGDHYRLTREISGRRINLAHPEESLLVAKALGEVPHSGGQRIEEDSEHLQTLLSWIAAGAEPDPLDEPQPVRIEVFPLEAVFAGKRETQKLLVLAHYSDGSDRDVSELSVFLSNNDSVATVSEDGLATATGSGGAFILARFDKFTEGTAIIVRPGTAYAFPEIPAENYVDELVYDRWRKMHLIPSGRCSDEVFLRRAYLDLVGLLPTPAQRQQFVADPDPEKRRKLIDELLKRDEFRDLWVMKWAEMLQIRTANGVSPKGIQLYDRWLRERVRSGATIDRIMQEVIPASGGTFENPATSYYQTETTPQILAENVAQAFLGTRIQCAQCHNHPFDRWTMDDYYGFAAFFSQVGYKQARDPREITIFNAATGVMRHPLGQREVPPRFLGGGVPKMAQGDDYRQALAEWIASPENPALARHLGNVVWAHFFGIGIVEPVDDVRVSNPPSNPALFAELGRKLAEYRYEIKPLVRDICNSRTYQLVTEHNASNALDHRNFPHGQIRRIRAEVLLDCLSQVTETQDRFPGLMPGARAVEVADGRIQNYFLTTFGRSTRQTPCTCEVKTSPTLSQALHLINGETTSGKIEEGGVVQRLLAERHDPMAVVADLYQRCYSRLPTDREAAAIAERLSPGGNIEAALVDLFWALLNSNEFIFNH
jgi:hypothetical protein